MNFMWYKMLSCPQIIISEYNPTYHISPFCYQVLDLLCVKFFELFFSSYQSSSDVPASYCDFVFWVYGVWGQCYLIYDYKQQQQQQQQQQQVKQELDVIRDDLPTFIRILSQSQLHLKCRFLFKINFLLSNIRTVALQSWYNTEQLGGVQAMQE